MNKPVRFTTFDVHESDEVGKICRAVGCNRQANALVTCFDNDYRFGFSVSACEAHFLDLGRFIASVKINQPAKEERGPGSLEKWKQE